MKQYTQYALFYNYKTIALLLFFLLFFNVGFSQFTGGYYSGFTKNINLCPPSVVSGTVPFTGGASDGFATNTVGCPPLVAVVAIGSYYGGNYSGFKSNYVACPVSTIVTSIYLGGINGGFSKNTQLCPPLVVSGTVPYTGGFYDGFATNTVACPPLVINSDVPAYYGGAYDGFVKFVNPFACISDDPLPIELAYFKVSCDKNKATIIWGTATQTNNDYFTLQKSSDAINFEYLTQINGAGTTSQMLHYSYIDENPLNGTSYYRLCQTDFDNTQVCMNIISVDCSKNYDIEVLVYPNPSNDIFNIVSSIGVGITVFNTVGQLIMHIDKTEVNQTILDLTDYASGIYFVKIASNYQSIVKRIIKN